MKEILWGGFFGLVLYFGFLRDDMNLDRFQKSIGPDLRAEMKKNCNNTTPVGRDRQICYCATGYMVDDVERYVNVVISQGKNHGSNVTVASLEKGIIRYMEDTLTPKLKSGKYHAQCM